MIDSQTSRTITSLRYLLSVLIVILHGIGDVTGRFGYAWILVFTQLSVPLFFFFSGFLAFQKDEKYGTFIKKKAFSLLVPFLLWTAFHIALYYGLKVFTCVARGNFDLITQSDLTAWLKGGPVKWLMLFIEYHPTNCTPYCGQMWYIRDLFLMMVLVPVIKISLKKIPVLLFIAAATLFYWNITYKDISYHYGTALLFFSAGGFCALKNFSVLSLKKVPVFVYAVIFVIFGTIVWTQHYFQYYMHPLLFKFIFPSFRIIGSLFYLRLGLLIVEMDNQKLYNKLASLASYSFWIYALHLPEPMHWLKHNLGKIIKFEGGDVLGGGIAIFIIVIFGTIAGILCRNYLPKVFAIMNGGRLPQKTVPAPQQND